MMPYSQSLELTDLFLGFVSKLEEQGVHDHRWVLFLLSELSDYCKCNGLTAASGKIEKVAVEVESELISDFLAKFTARSNCEQEYKH